MTLALELIGESMLGGILVVVFSIIGEIIKPRTFSGLFGSAPSIALGGLIISAVTQNISFLKQQLIGMIFGSFGMIVYCITAYLLLKRIKALKASSLALITWFIVTYLFFTRL